MQSLKLYDIKDIRFEDADVPKLKSENDVIIKIHSCGICGSDISRYKLLGPYVKGMIWGHEFSGEVVDIGKNVKNVNIGDRVAGCPVVFDGIDYYYKKGEYNRSDFNRAIGALRPGAFAEYISLPSQNLLKIPDTLDYDSAALIEPSTVVIHGLYRTNLDVGDSVVVVGAGGPIGLLAIQWSKIFGAKKIIAIDISEQKLVLAKRAGADFTINGMDKNIENKIQEYTNGLKANLVIEAAGTPITAAQVFMYAKKGGGILFLGIPYGDVNIKRYSFEKILRSELTVWGSWSCVSAPFPGREWINSIDYFANKMINTDIIITHRLPLKEGPNVFEDLISNKDSYGKVILHPGK